MLQGDSLLHYAIKKDKLNFVKILTEYGLSMKRNNLEDKTPMELAFSKKNIKAMKSMML